MRSPNSSATKITDIPQAVGPNGMTALGSHGVLIGDAAAGVVYHVDTHSGAYQVAIDDPLLKPVSGAPFVIGINGLHINGEQLYFTNSDQAIFARVPVDSSNGTAKGAVEVLASTGLVDDFTLDNAGNAFIAQNGLNTIEKFTPSYRSGVNGTVAVVAGSNDSPVLSSPTATKFGRTWADSKVLYATTGGLFNETLGSGKVVGIHGLA